jgi:hypothetical protein
MIYPGVQKKTLPEDVKIGKYVLNLTDNSIYGGSINSAGVRVWEQVPISTMSVQNREVDYFFNECDEYLYSYDTVNGWTKTDLSRPFDDSVKLYNLKNGKLVNSQPLRVDDITIPQNVTNKDIINGFVNITLPVQYDLITVSKRSNVSSFTPVNDDPTSTTGVVTLNPYGFAQVLSYYYYEAGVQRINVTVDFIVLTGTIPDVGGDQEGTITLVPPNNFIASGEIFGAIFNIVPFGSDGKQTVFRIYIANQATINMNIVVTYGVNSGTNVTATLSFADTPNLTVTLPSVKTDLTYTINWPIPPYLTNPAQVITVVIDTPINNVGGAPANFIGMVFSLVANV